MRICAIYTRKSQKDEDRQVNSHDRQLNEIESFCKNNDFIIYRRFSDSQTGLNNERSGWKGLLEFLDQSAEHYAVISSVSRMGRNMSLWSDIEHLLPQFRFVETGSSAPNLTTISVLLAVAAAESRRISKRVKSAYAQLKSKHGDELRWGNPDIGKLSSVGHAANRAKMFDHWVDILATDHALSVSLPNWTQERRIAHLNYMGYTTRSGRPIDRFNLLNAHRRIGTGGAKAMGEL